MGILFAELMCRLSPYVPFPGLIYFVVFYMYIPKPHVPILFIVNLFIKVAWGGEKNIRLRIKRLESGAWT